MAQTPAERRGLVVNHQEGKVDLMATPMFEVENLHVNIEDKEILKGVNLTINAPERLRQKHAGLRDRR
jgi:ABC-type molybdenum transport system ATPase subunit/photorepair protein PhrA